MLPALELMYIRGAHVRNWGRSGPRLGERRLPKMTLSGSAFPTVRKWISFTDVSIARSAARRDTG